MHRGIRQLASLYSYFLVVTASWVFSPRVSPQPYHPIYQTSSNRITFWTHLFHQVIQLLTLTYAKRKLTFNNHFTVFAILHLIPQYLRCQVDETRLITIHMTSSLSRKIWFMTTGKLLMRKWGNITLNLTKKTLNLTISQQLSIIRCIRIKIRITHHTICIHHRPRFLPLWSQLTRRLYHWKAKILQKWLFVDSQIWDQLTRFLCTPHQYRTQGETSMDIKNFYNHIKYVPKYSD